MSRLEEIEQEKAKLNAELAELAKKEAKILKEERPTIIARINADIARYKINVEDLKFESEGTGTQEAQASRPKTTLAAKFRNPQTGDTWSGRGTAPKWIREAPDREIYRIK